MFILRKHRKALILSILIILNIFVWGRIHSIDSGELLSVYFFDVGQGDAIFIETPSRGRLLLDGGPNRAVLSQLGAALPFGDRRIDIVVGSHPDKDHIGGLPEVVSRYRVGVLFESGAQSVNSIDGTLRSRIEDNRIPVYVARRGMRIDFGDGVELVVLFPNTDVGEWSTNDASIVAKLSYKGQSFLLTGDASLKTENALLGINPEELNSTVLKAGHHGSKTSSSQFFVKEVSPEYVIISAGKNNSYGHPHKEVIDRFKSIGSVILSTAEIGSIHLETDGEEIWIK